MPERSVVLGRSGEGGGPLELALETFAENTGARIAVLLSRSGMLLAQKGMKSRGEMVQLAALAAGIHSAGARLGAELRDSGIAQLHNSGERCQLFLSEFRTPVQPILLLSVFDADATPEALRPAFEEFGRALTRLPGWPEAGMGGDEELETVLLKNLDRLFPES